MLQLIPAVALLAASVNAQQAPSSAAAKPPQSSPTAQVAVEPAAQRPFDHPAEAQEFYLRKRLPLGETRLPVESYFAAREQMKGMRQHAAATDELLASRAEAAGGAAQAAALAAAAGWTNVGPGNVGGRTLALLIDPRDATTIYAGTADGGIWKTTDKGASWAPAGDMLPSLAVASLVMDPHSSAILYAGTGEGAFNIDAAPGAGIFVTSDAGQHWTQMPGTATADFSFVQKLALNPAGNRLYAATGTGVWAYDAAAQKWAQLLKPPTFGGCFDLALRQDGSGNDVLLAACGTFLQGAVFRNTQAQVGGTPWAVVLTNAAMGRTTLAMAPSNPDIVYALVTSNADGPHHGYNQGLLGVFRSTQGGAAGTWEARLLNSSHDTLSTLLLTNPVIAELAACGFGSGFALNQGWYDTVIAVDPTNPDRVWAGGIDLFRSEDGGKTFGVASYWWTQPDPPYNHADQHALAFAPGYDAVKNQELFIGNDGGVFFTANSLAPIGKGSVLALCNDKASSVVFTDLNHGFSATQFYDGTVFPDGAAYFGGTQDNGTVAGTDQTGANGWVTILGGDGGFVAVDPTATNVLYAENTGLSIQKSIDGGQNFLNAVGGIADNNFLFIAPFIMDTTNSKRLWTGGSYLWRTDNGAARWSRASARIAGSLHSSVSAIASSPVDANVVLMGTAEGVVHHNAAALSAKATTAWPWSKPRVGYVSWLAFDPANAKVAYATYTTFGGTHVWKTADGGVTWTGIDGSGSGALPDVPVSTIAVDPADGTHLYIGTDLGVFVSTDGGQSWAVEATGFPDSVTDALVIHAGQAGSRTLFAFTHGRGVWRVSLP
jgi:hypothetical protein